MKYQVIEFRRTVDDNTPIFKINGSEPFVLTTKYIVTDLA
jgi:hypothetical protein